jgi:hypothetical protein
VERYQADESLRSRFSNSEWLQAWGDCGRALQVAGKWSLNEVWVPVENLGIFLDSSSKLVLKVIVDHSAIFQLPSPPPLPRCDFSHYKVRSQLRHPMPCCDVIFHWETMTVNDLRRIMFALGGTHSGTSFYSMNVLFYWSSTYQTPQIYLIHGFGATCINTSQDMFVSWKIRTMNILITIHFLD